MALWNNIPGTDDLVYRGEPLVRETLPGSPSDQRIYTELGSIKDRALAIQSNLSNLKNQDIADVSSDNTQRNLTSLTEQLAREVKNSGEQESTILQKYAERKQQAEQATEASKKLTESEYGTALEETKAANEREKTAELESRRGFATNTAVVRQIEETGQKRIRDLTKARDEAMLKADIAKADRLDSLLTDEQTMITQSRQNWLSNLTGLIGTITSVAGFETPAQKQQRELSSATKTSIMTLQAQFPDAGITANDTYEQAIAKTRNSATYKLNQQKSEAEIKSIEADVKYKNALTNKASADLNGDVLTDTDLKNIDGSPQGKKLTTLSSLRLSAERYKQLLKDYGYEMFGTGRTLLEGAYADLEVKWKEAANLGALTGPDLELIMDSVKPATGLRGLGSISVGGGTSGIISGVDELLNKIDTEGQINYVQLLNRNSKYQNSDYVQGLGIPFYQPKEKTENKNKTLSGNQINYSSPRNLEYNSSVSSFLNSDNKYAKYFPK